VIVSVILCTYNRGESLAIALNSVAASKVPDSVSWEVLVVDNNSSDRTRVVIEECCKKHPGRFRYLFERRQGKSYALNTGVQEADGDVLAFMDDDVTVDSNWLQNLTASLQSEGWAGAGGRILPEKELSVPRWLALHGQYYMGGILALFDQGDKPGKLNCAPYGTNMAFRRVMFEKYGGFRTDMGPRPGSQIRNEDTEFGRRLMGAGEQIRYEPAAMVYHRIAESRLRKEYLLACRFDCGRSLVREVGWGADVLGIPRPYLRLLKATLDLGELTLRWILAWNRQARFFYQLEVWMRAGQIVEGCRLIRRGVVVGDQPELSV
jgi:glycosyltransferase involved in cell wall biosynthesis